MISVKRGKIQHFYLGSKNFDYNLYHFLIETEYNSLTEETYMLVLIGKNSTYINQIRKGDEISWFDGLLYKNLNKLGLISIEDKECAQYYYMWNLHDKLMI